MRHRYQNSGRAALAMAVSAALTAPVLAQQNEDTGLVIEEVRVTATRRGDTDIMKTPVAVTAIDNAAIEKFSPRDLNDVAAMVPSLSAGQVPAFNSASFAMRGVSETTIIVYKESPVGVIIDDFVVNHVQTQNLEMFDIESIEVLRGPQGTLFGKNTTAGTINVTTKRPEHDERSIDVRYELGDWGKQKLSTAINLPIVEDKLAFRLAGIQLESDGYFKNGAQYGPLTVRPGGAIEGQTGQGDGDDIGGDDVLSLRAKLLWSPTPDFDALLQYERIDDQGDTRPLVNESEPGYFFDTWGFTQDGGDPLDNAGVTNQDDFLMEMSDGHIVKIDGIYLNLDWRLGNFSLHSVTGYREQESHLPSTYDGEVYRTLFDATRDDERDTFQQELRLASDLNGPFNFVTGIYYQEEEIDFCVLQVVGFVDLLLDGEPTFLSENPLILCNAQDAEALAAYIDGTYDVTDRLHISAGFRYTDEKKEWTGRPRRPIQALPDGGFDPNFTWRELGDPLAAADFERFPAGVISDSESWQEPTYRFHIAYDFSDDLFGWFGYSRGFKSGGYSDQIGTALDPIPEAAARPTEPEIADSFEVGVKSIMAGGAANVQATAFYVEYSDAQRTLNASFPTGQETLFFNAAELEVKGLELEGSWIVAEGLVLRGNAMWQDAQFNEFIADTDFDGEIDVDLSGKEPTRSPEWMATIDATYTLTYDFGSFDFNVRMAYEDESIFSYSDVGDEFDTTINEKTIYDASVSYTAPNGKWWVRGLAKNFTDERYRTGSLSVGNFWVMSSYGAPRYYGLEVGAKFDF